MIYTVVSVRDRAANAFGRPAYVASEGAGIRSFMDEINREAPDNVMHQHADDFDLFCLGTWNDETGFLQQYDVPKQIAVGKQLKVKG